MGSVNIGTVSSLRVFSFEIFFSCHLSVRISKTVVSARAMSTLYFPVFISSTSNYGIYCICNSLIFIPLFLLIMLPSSLNAFSLIIQSSHSRIPGRCLVKLWKSLLFILVVKFHEVFFSLRVVRIYICLRKVHYLHWEQFLPCLHISVFERLMDSFLFLALSSVLDTFPSQQ